MKFSEWVSERSVRDDTTRHAVYVWVRERTGIAITTLSNLDRGALLKTYDRAASIQRATDGAVTVKDLCE